MKKKTVEDAPEQNKPRRPATLKEISIFAGWLEDRARHIKTESDLLLKALEASDIGETTKHATRIKIESDSLFEGLGKLKEEVKNARRI